MYLRTICVACSVVVLFVLSGCGTKGDLYLPNKEPRQTQVNP